MSSLKELFLLAGVVVIVYQLEKNVIPGILFLCLYHYHYSCGLDYASVISFERCSRLYLYFYHLCCEWIFSHFCLSWQKYLNWVNLMSFIHFSLFYSKGNMVKLHVNWQQQCKIKPNNQRFVYSFKSANQSKACCEMSVTLT